MKSSYLCMFMLLGLCVIVLGCNDNSDYSSTIPVSQVSFVDYGAVVPNPISTTVTISPNSIVYTSTQSGNIIEQWSNQIEAADFDSIQQIINEYSLFYSNDITLASGQEPCEGSGGMTISMNGVDISHTINIAGTVCSRDQWPEGIHSLVDLKDSLVEKYH